MWLLNFSKKKELHGAQALKRVSKYVNFYNIKSMLLETSSKYTLIL
jgi:hypothetical protein